jgi:hypothetical protein
MMDEGNLAARVNNDLFGGGDVVVKCVFFCFFLGGDTLGGWMDECSRVDRARASCISFELTTKPSHIRPA